MEKLHMKEKRGTVLTLSEHSVSGREDLGD